MASFYGDPAFEAYINDAHYRDAAMRNSLSRLADIGIAVRSQQQQRARDAAQQGQFQQGFGLERDQAARNALMQAMELRRQQTLLPGEQALAEAQAKHLGAQTNLYQAEADAYRNPASDPQVRKTELNMADQDASEGNFQKGRYKTLTQEEEDYFDRQNQGAVQNYQASVGAAQIPPMAARAALLKNVPDVNPTVTYNRPDMGLLGKLFNRFGSGVPSDTIVQPSDYGLARRRALIAALPQLTAQSNAVTSRPQNYGLRFDPVANQYIPLMRPPSAMSIQVDPATGLPPNPMRTNSVAAAIAPARVSGFGTSPLPAPPGAAEGSTVRQKSTGRTFTVRGGLLIPVPAQ